MMERYRVEERESNGYTTFRLVDRVSQSCAEVVPAIGFNLFHYLFCGMEVIAQPMEAHLPTLQERSAEFGIPILFPPNRTKRGKLLFQQRIYQLPINGGIHHLHGELRHLPWKVSSYGNSESDGAFIMAEFRMAEHPRLWGYFPHDLSFQFTYRLKDGKLELEGMIANEGKGEAPFGLGFHPYFSYENEPNDKVEIRVPAAAQYKLDSEGFPLSLLPIVTSLSKELNAGTQISELPIHPDHMLLKLKDQTKLHECRIHRIQKGMTIIFRFDSQFPYLAVFKPPWMNAISLEPYSCMTNAFNLNLPIEETGAQGLGSGESFSFKWEIEPILAGGKR